MKNIRKNESGITMIALVITVIVMLIIASIAIVTGNSLIKDANVQTIETNMLTIKAKAKSYAEEVDAQVWALENKNEESKKRLKENYGMNEYTETLSPEIVNQLANNIKNEYVLYDIIGAAEKMGIGELENKDRYLVIYSLDDYKNMDVIYKDGINYKDTVYYTLSSLQEVLENK